MKPKKLRFPFPNKKENPISEKIKLTEKKRFTEKLSRKNLTNSKQKISPLTFL